jgi:tetratricopeptide (TPR) repeat protein
MSDLKDPVGRIVADLANDLTLACDEDTGPKQGRGRAIFLIGAGCSISAGIPAAPGVAKHCATMLAKTYSRGAFTDNDPNKALSWLVENGTVELSGDLSLKKDGSHWGRLYSYFFEAHLKSPNQQRDVINEIIDQASDGLNWAHACLGELVNKRYVHTVLTTNFDQLVLQGIIRTGIMPVTADGLEALNRITGKPKRPQVIHLHGSMHTYNLRNSRVALSETSSDRGALSMIHSLLQQCDLLVVVGYGGGEEGVMQLLREAAQTLPQLVIYWVTYQKGIDSLSKNARALLSGENKFTIWGGSADKFFGDLMAQLGIGQPDWVADPIAVLSGQSERLRLPEHELEDVHILINGFKERVKFANDPQHRWPEQGELRIKAAAKRARGEYQEARELLEQIDRSIDVEAARMHALNLHSLFEEDPDKGKVLLDDAISELTALLEKTEGQKRLDNLLSLCEAELDKSEVLQDQERIEVLRHVVELSTDNLPRYSESDHPLGHARLMLYRAQALQALGEPTDDHSKLKESEAAYNKAIEVFVANNDSSGKLVDAKSGLAAVLQVLGETSVNSEILRKSVALHREIVEASRGSEQLVEEAGPLENLANCVLALSRIVDPEEADRLKSEAKLALERATRIYERQGKTEQERLARSALEGIDSSPEPKTNATKEKSSESLLT